MTTLPYVATKPVTLPRPCGQPAGLALAAMLLFAGLAAPAWAQYKVVQPDGSVVYTDRPPAASTARVTALGAKGAADAAAAGAGGAGGAAAKGEPTKLSALPLAGLPSELRNAVQRYPVTLYASPDCGPCDAGRQLLQKRGVPHLERKVATDEDLRAFERQFGTRSMPFLTIGSQQLRGYSMSDWVNYLDAAAYPAESKLPKGWKAPEATAMADKAPPPAPSAEPSSPRAAPPAAGRAEAPAAAPSGIRF